MNAIPGPDFDVLGFVCAVLQVGLLWFALFHVFRFLRRTRGYRLLFSFLGLLAATYGVARAMRLEELLWLLNHLFTVLPTLMVVLFQPELRRLFAVIGGAAPRQKLQGEAAANVVTQISKAVDSLSQQRIGALVALERTENLDAYAIGGRSIAAPVNAELITTVFWPGSPLHDGGMIIRNGTIAWAGCVFPLGEMDDRRRAFGTRHRAAIGLAERTDALVLAVSEETGFVSVAYRGELLRGLGTNSVVKILRACIAPEPGAGNPDKAISEIRESGSGSDGVAAAIAAVKEES